MQPIFRPRHLPRLVAAIALFVLALGAAGQGAPRPDSASAATRAIPQSPAAQSGVDSQAA